MPCGGVITFAPLHQSPLQTPFSVSSTNGNIYALLPFLSRYFTGAFQPFSLLTLGLRRRMRPLPPSTPVSNASSSCIPAAVGAEVVDARHPIGLHRRLLFLGVLAPIALYLDDEIERIVRAVPVIHPYYEIGPIFPRLGATAVRHLESEIVAFSVSDHPRVRFGDAAELGFPVAVEHDPVDVILRRRTAGVPPIRP